MSEALYPYYERELIFIRQLSQEFARRYPAAAGRLLRPPFPPGLAPIPRTAAVLRLKLDCLGGLKFADLALDALRFYLVGENQFVASLYELLFNHALRVVFRPLGAGATGEPV